MLLYTTPDLAGNCKSIARDHGTCTKTQVGAQSQHAREAGLELQSGRPATLCARRSRLQALKIALAFAYSALPCAVLPPTPQKPLMPSSFLAAMTALIQDSALLPLYAFFREADAALETTLPCLFFMS